MTPLATENANLEEALRQNEERLKFLIENTPLAVIEWGPDFRLVRWSKEAERIFGWQAGEVLGKKIDEFRWVYDEDTKRVDDISKGLMEGTRPRSVSKNRNYRKDGSVVYCEWYNSSLVDSEGKLVSVLSFVLDVTERRRVEERNQHFATFPEMDHNPILEADRSGKVLYANPAAMEIIRSIDGKLEPEAFLPQEWKGIINIVDAGEVKSYQCEAKIGNRIFIEDISPLKQLGIIRIYAKEITEEKKAQAKLLEAYSDLEEKVRERTQKLEMSQAELLKDKAKDEALLSSLGEGLIATDSEGNVTLMNKPAENMLGYQYKFLKDKRYTQFVQAISVKGRPILEQNRPIYRALRGEKSVVTYNYVRRDKTLLPVVVTTTPVWEDGVITGAILVFRDITKELEVDRAKTEFVSLASHQLLTPLSAINWYTEVLLTDDLSPEDRHKYCQEIYQSNRRMIVLVNDLLNVSRIELGTLNVKPEAVEIKEFCGNIIHELSVKLHANRSTVVEDYKLTGMPIWADKKTLFIIIENLLSNAVKYSPKGSLIYLNVADTQDRQLYITVKDEGYGIPEHQQHKIFNKLFRADNVKSKDTDGNGLGLYLVKSIVDYVGGKIYFESAENKGTTFYVRLPIRENKDIKI